MKKQISFNAWSLKSVEAAMRALKAYQRDLRSKCEQFVIKLSERGIEVAKARLADTQNEEGKELSQYVTFTTELSPVENGAKAIMFASSGSVTRQWVTKDGERSVDISPILMLEFGSGVYGDSDHASKFGMGKGTFPGQTHAEDPSGWWWQTLDGEWHHSRGIPASMPVDKAMNAMIEKVYEVAREVFG